MVFDVVSVLLKIVSGDRRYCVIVCIGRQEGGTMTDRVKELMKDMPNKKFLRPAEVAALLNVSAKTVYRWCDIGLIESVKLNGSIRVLRDSVINFLEKNMTVN